ncbi:hypothetical protein J2Y45_002179 [Dyadobacter sp. BE34]|uniref:Uncharacterized protein n=1 Tax=Dyadobacter fermentans TaxID=94254 RepID=A0ABU1QWJ4_9BACT|nr:MULTISPECIES: hypothetical protein [Dyadobacter]MDR6805512.1 hypothetical protein [Dyadobacter fermentans]MDR7042728.1 hypothetical protein [Dyadobacter sp. BE242]MDR7197040.1 hypothetical protein [Dyadobacter sp. BE34]MDR7215525.1 hypothetical protein [Dyadobacter sp. BE31]MDR7263061.1 hypothetical protein [Dyadobacter sp. BE32]
MTKAGLWGMDEWIGAMDEKWKGGLFTFGGLLTFCANAMFLVGLIDDF